MNNEFFLNPLRGAFRAGDAAAIKLHLQRLFRKSKEPAIDPRFRTEIALESVKALRVLDRRAEAVRMADEAIANIPADCFDLLSGLKRLRTLLYLDAGQAAQARLLIEETDGLELVLQGGESVITRHDTEVEVETWLISTEVALTEGNIPQAEKFFEKAINRLSKEEADLRRKGTSFFEKKRLRQFYADLTGNVNLYACVLRLVNLNSRADALAELEEMAEQVRLENETAGLRKMLPNVPLESKIKCLLGRNCQFNGIATAEAERWQRFGKGEFGFFSQPVEVESGKQSGKVAALSSVTPAVNGLDVVDWSSQKKVTDDDSLRRPQLYVRMEQLFERIDRVLPHFANYLDAGQDFSQRGFGGHLLDTDLFTLFFNCKKLRLTGLMKFSWNPSLFNNPILKAMLPEIVRSGEATLFLADGAIIDCVFKGQPQSNTAASAQDNLVLLIRLCFEIETDNVSPDIQAKVLPEEAVRERPALLNVRDEAQLLAILTDLESKLAGIGVEAENEFDPAKLFDEDTLLDI